MRMSARTDAPPGAWPRAPARRMVACTSRMPPIAVATAGRRYRRMNAPGDNVDAKGLPMAGIYAAVVRAGSPATASRGTCGPAAGWRRLGQGWLLVLFRH